MGCIDSLSINGDIRGFEYVEITLRYNRSELDNIICILVCSLS